MIFHPHTNTTKRLVGSSIVLISTLVSLRLSAAPAGTPVIEPKVIYGDDDRRDLFDPGLDPRLVALGRSTAVLIKKENLSTDTAAVDFFNLRAATLESTMNVCANEPFHDQPSAGFCSGFLVGADLLVTAGHCITNQTDCEGTAFGFGYWYENATGNPKRLAKKDVFSCKSIVGRFQDPMGTNKLDFAVIKLDRPAVGRRPLPIRRTGSLAVGENLTVMGYPSGIPLKIAGGAAARSIDNEVYFTANLDTYGGNSGSAVVNTISGEVEGILVRGERDYVAQGDCLVSNHCTNDGCRGEDVTKIANVLQYVPAH